MGNCSAKIFFNKNNVVWTLQSWYQFTPLPARHRIEGEVVAAEGVSPSTLQAPGWGADLHRTLGVPRSASLSPSSPAFSFLGFIRILIMRGTEGGSVRLSVHLWFLLRSGSHGCGMEPCVRLCAQCGVCFRFFLPPPPPSPVHTCSLSLSDK